MSLTANNYIFVILDKFLTTYEINHPVNILDLTPLQLRDFVKHLGGSAPSSDRIWKGIYQEYAVSFEEISCINPPLAGKLAQNSRLSTLAPLEEITSIDAQTRKVLFRLEDGKTIESALMLSRNYATGRERQTVCVSSQVGCAVGCSFCATGRQGFERNLSPGEIIEQVLYFVRRFRRGVGNPGNGKGPAWPTNIVFMGMGEPLANFDNVRQAIAILNSQKGMGFGVHQVTLSTAGIVPQIHRLADEHIQFQLAVSLHAANDKLRDMLVPLNKKYPLAQLISACMDYNRATRRNIFIEYALFEGINDSIEQAIELGHLLQGLKCTINLILGNPTGSNDIKPSSYEAGITFQKSLMSAGFRTMLRFSRGADINAGCGQLKSRYQS